eukprot:2793378-Rhodomonas_salina.1
MFGTGLADGDLSSYAMSGTDTQRMERYPPTRGARTDVHARVQGGLGPGAHRSLASSSSSFRSTRKRPRVANAAEL